jgi:hypothetical protein
VLEESTLAKTAVRYPPELRRQMVDWGASHGGGLAGVRTDGKRSGNRLHRTSIIPTGDDGLTTAEHAELNRLRREKGGGGVRSGDENDPSKGFQFESDHKADYPIDTTYRLLAVSSYGYHARVKRQVSRRAVTEAALMALPVSAGAGSSSPRLTATAVKRWIWRTPKAMQLADIRAAHAGSRGTHGGAPHIETALCRQARDAQAANTDAIGGQLGIMRGSLK